jgi:hypothetical protein
LDLEPGIQDPRSGIGGTGSEIRDPEFEIQDPRSGIRKRLILDSGSGARGTTSTGSRIRNSGSATLLTTLIILTSKFANKGLLICKYCTLYYCNSNSFGSETVSAHLRPKIVVK